MILRCFAVALACLVLWLPKLHAASPAAEPDFKEVERIVREHLVGATDESLNRAAVDGFLAELKGRVSLLRTNAPESTNTAPAVSREEYFSGGVGYARVGRIDADLPGAVRAAVKHLSATNKLFGLVLDLRYTDGDNYAAAVNTVDEFLGKELPLLNAGKGLLSSHEKTNAIRLPVVALVNNETSRAAEALAAMLRQVDVGLLLGSRTAGHAAITTDVTLSNGQTLRIATGPVQLGDAKAIPSTGVRPDIEVTVKPDAERAYYADPFAVAPGLSEAGANTGGTNSVAALQHKRVRLTEADLVREHRGDGDFETVTNARVSREPTVPQVQDPVLARAIDLLKGLAVVRQGKF